ncbi:cobaltochelatase CobT-related protein [Granulosicoccus sp. 3-233]|uniref:cobaltochelatase CobT-related protein n=1 Tax=Granulosicoccus sp. 3-233 TaxID=3417969 RepID=UPI003D33372F
MATDDRKAPHGGGLKATASPPVQVGQGINAPRDDESHMPESFRQSTGACARAIARDTSIDITFDDAAADVEGMVLPGIPDDATELQRRQTRGRSDAIALHKQHHDARTHARHQPTTDTSQRLHAMAEQTRVELLGANMYEGVGRNLDAALDGRYRLLLDTVAKPVIDLRENKSEPRLGIEHALSLYLREQLGNRPLPAAAAETLSDWREWLSSDVADKFRPGDFNLEDQAGFARALGQLLRSLEMENGDPSDNPEDLENEEQQSEDMQSEQDQSESTESDSTSLEEDGESESMEDDDGNAEDGSDIVEPEEDMPERSSESPGSEWRATAGEAQRRSLNDYHVYTQEFDEVIRPLDLCDVDELTRLRQTLDSHIGDLQRQIGRFANRLQRVLMAQQRRSWEFDLEEGQLDTARLTRVLTDPMMPLTFKQESETPFRDTVVTLLLDNSGSMHGRSIRVAAVCADILSSTLERCGVRVEILGFTTCAWKGGRSREKWVAGGYPANPGRLNDLRHIIYKAADTPWRQSRRNLGLMMRKGLLKENIDGEALQWAHGRLLQRTEQRRILMMISDGAPIDDSTLSTNPGRFLEKHLRHVIAQIERQDDVELVAIGIGHDVRQYYSRATTIHDVAQLADVMTSQLVDLFSTNRARQPR